MAVGGRLASPLADHPPGRETGRKHLRPTRIPSGTSSQIFFNPWPIFLNFSHRWGKISEDRNAVRSEGPAGGTGLAVGGRLASLLAERPPGR